MGLRGKTLGIWAALVAVGLLAASPFLCRDLVGTGEAYNYSLAVGDAVQQMRHGDVPPLVGQTELAFNGRVHPLRNAPYLFYLAAAIDAVTLHQLTPWQLQNASLVYSILLAVLACYAGLRWATGCSQVTAFLLASVYGLSSPLLCAANQLDLFMTVHAAMFAPVAVAACIKGCREPSFSADAWLAAALAATWLAHPPVAVWLTFSLVAVRVIDFAIRPSWSVLVSGACAVALFALLSCFVFASVATLNTDLGFFADASVFRPFVDVVMNGIRKAFVASFLPVTRTASATGDLQYGYVPWILTIGATIAAYRMRKRGMGALPAVVLSVACFVLVLMLPVPVVTRLLWRMIPGSVLTLTTEWPMQRLYLVALGLGLFGAGLVAPSILGEWRRPRWALPCLVLLGSVWTAYQAAPFIKLGYADRRSHAETEAIYRPSNLNLTVTSYAFLGLPPTYNHGVVDPSMEFRILQDGKDEVSSNLSSAFSASPVVGQGSIAAQKGTPRTAISKPVVLQPCHRYLLTFAFKAPSINGYLSIIGSSIQRYYGLPSSGEALGFGMLDGQRKTIPIWTDLPKPESVVLGIVADPGFSLQPGLADFADYSLQDVDPKSLPVRVNSFLPLRFTVDQPLTECTVETPRRFISGYEATVNGLEVTPLISPSRQLMVPIPAGHSVVEIRYVGARLARVAFWICLGSWILFWIWRLVGSPLPSRPLERSFRAARTMWLLACRHGVVIGAVAAGVLFLGFHERQKRRDREDLAAVGPIKIDFKLPYRQLGVNQPILKTGKPGAGVIVFADIVDGGHIRISADVWGKLYPSAVLPVDFFKVQSVVVSDSALYPVGNPVVKSLSSEDRTRLRGELRVELNGKIVIQQKCYAYESKPGEVEIGHASMGSMTGPDFLGEILGHERLFIPQTKTLPASDRASLRVRFPVLSVGQSQPLASLTCGSQRLTFFISKLPDGLHLAMRANDGYEATSDALVLDPLPEHTLVFEPEVTGPSDEHFGISAVIDGRQELGTHNPEPPAAPSVVFPGLDQNQTEGVDVRFTGDLSDITLISKAVTPPNAVPMSELHLILAFPAGKDGRHEPILTTGHTGAGDLIYAVYEDAGHIRIGVDHWGGAGALSDPIPVDYSLPHELWIRSGALYPQAAGDPAWHGLGAGEQQILKSKVEVVFDGRHVLEASVTAHPSTPEEITVGLNKIGMSTADPEFGGRIELSERTSLAPPPK